MQVTSPRLVTSIAWRAGIRSILRLISRLLSIFRLLSMRRSPRRGGWSWVDEAIPLFRAPFWLLSRLAQADDSGREALVGRSARQGPILQVGRESPARENSATETNRLS